MLMAVHSNTTKDSQNHTVYFAFCENQYNYIFNIYSTFQLIFWPFCFKNSSDCFSEKKTIGSSEIYFL